ncbi:MFS transporter [Bacillus massilinigeriensis]|uniref:MFS transporter n=1 Tax=Bacillus massilionigeriensis TaxID=1805475 RepID=UPI00096B3433|nr:MFS transporter [Bacillus massilionigeriensis]
MIVEKDGKTTDEISVKRPGHQEMLSYGLGALGLFGIWTFTGTFLTYYYTDVVGVAAGIVGTLMVLVRFLDGFADVGMGVVVDRTRTKYGKTRPWILWMAIPIGVSNILLFTVPETSMLGKIVYLYITFIIFNLVFTALSIPFKTLLGMMTQDHYGRGVANIYSGFFNMIGTMLVFTLSQPLAERFGWTLIASVLSVVAIIFLLLTFRGTKERASASILQDEKIGVNKGVKALFQNKYWVIITLSCIVFYADISVVQSAGIYYATYILGNTNYFSLIGLALTIPMIIGLLFVAPLVKRMGKRNVALVGGVIAIIGQLVKLIDPSSLSIFLIGSVITGFGAMPLLGFILSMINDTIEYGEWRTGIRTEGLINSGASFGIKVGTGLGLALIGWLLAIGKYVGGAAEQTDAAISMILALNVYVPLILTAILLCLLTAYKLDKQYPNILAELLKRKNESKK